jgi:hypothetical protein
MGPGPCAIAASDIAGDSAAAGSACNGVNVASKATAVSVGPAEEASVFGSTATGVCIGLPSDVTATVCQTGFGTGRTFCCGGAFSGVDPPRRSGSLPSDLRIGDGVAVCWASPFVGITTLGIDGGIGPVGAVGSGAGMGPVAADRFAGTVSFEEDREGRIEAVLFVASVFAVGTVIAAGSAGAEISGASAATLNVEATCSAMGDDSRGVGLCTTSDATGFDTTAAMSPVGVVPGDAIRGGVIAGTGDGADVVASWAGASPAEGISTRGATF